MKKLIEKVRREIENRMEQLYEALPDSNKVIEKGLTVQEANITGKYSALESLLSFIDSLQEEQKED